MDETYSGSARRSFLARVSAGIAAFAATAGSATLSAQTPAAAGPFQPARHAEDDWLDAVPGKHRFVVDTLTPDGFAQALFFNNNFYTGNQSGYNLQNTDLAVVIIARHQSTGFAYTNAMWAKYGAPLAQRAGDFVDPRTKQAPTTNVNLASVEAAVRRGVHFAVCQMATRANAGVIARASGGNADDIYKELAANLVGNAHLVPAGIVTVNRAQERGYTFSYGG